ncbi:MAG: hypothetical protein GX330_06850, partial [Bacteroidales bacterium]|nr:hypothetical protein [Bacteroidales bacterium]
GVTPKSLGGGKYEIVPSSNLVGKRVTISVSADLGTGRTQNMGGQEFRVRAVPNPVAYIGSNISSGKISRDLLKGNQFLTARMENFDFALAWRVTSYRVTVVKNGREVASVVNNGPQFVGSVQNAVNSATPGTVFEFTEIKARSIAGIKNLSNITVRVR